ncbi:MAG: N-acetylglucosamine-specific PTS transporter subunit IIBC [Providencia heimbachae]|uniref:PTS system N-acetylglucosamine-specific IIABC component n=4 Tax=Enterobacterales TaxID=91347 RepID=A0A1B7JZ33_9GAMM|nr:N-acetylglucosamine-specific PTS transporter subunit IIBC [Providencia heimbachae]MDD9339395.1 N-acetylglucosamine-specific PTS transporter subunit IIBC [Providencia heimbachae]OAT53173.1 PTS system N-acetylglucosamine-specific IIABC component [Providencia heimbachae ATCC 35613]
MNILSYLQRIGRALMVPVAVLPAAAILMGIGYWIDPDGWGANSAIAALLIKSGAAIIDNMSVLFAIGVAYGMSKDKDGAAALTGFVGFLVVTTLCSPASYSMIMNVPLESVPAAFNKINNQFVGILVGVLSAELYNRYSGVELPKALSFFSGRRLVPILTSFLMIILAFILMYVWPVVYNGLVSFGESIKDMGSVGAGIYGFFNRLLIPVGLHHALNSVFWFDVAGINDIPNFLGGAKSIDAGLATVGITGRYQAGFFPIMMFGLPGAALAIYHCARPENKAKVAGIMIAGAFAAFFTGITEPLEFSFMFVAPVLYVIHALLTGISIYIAASMEWISGFGFSAGLVDMLLQTRNPLAVKWFMLIVQGLVFFCIYYVIFRFMIRKFNLLTPGREESSDDETIDGYDESLSAANNGDSDIQKEARQYVSAVGGSDNIVNIDACITRLRLTVKDSSVVNDAMTKRLGAAGVIRLNKQNVQVIVGTRAELVAKAMTDVIAKGPIAASAPVAAAAVAAVKASEPAKAKGNIVLSLVAPVSGQVYSLDDVPDEAFSSRIVGDGIAIKPTSSEVLAPASGTVVKIFETNHAFCLETENGVELIVHMGIDTVALKGEGCSRLVEEGAEVEAGTPILNLDLAFLEANAKSMISPVIISNIDDFAGVEILVEGEVIAGKTVIYNVLK